MPTIDEVLEYSRSSTRRPGQCLGFVGNDITGHFGSYPRLYDSAKAAANSLGSSLNTSPCPSDPHFDFYNFVEDGVNYGHIDIHVPSRGFHISNSGRCNVWLNSAHTVGTYPEWGGPRLGWSYQPGAGDSISFTDSPGTAPASTSSAPSGSGWATNLPSSAVQLRIQTALWKRGRYGGARDGVFGQLSWMGIQRTISNVGYRGPHDGIPGPSTCHYLQVYAARFGGYKGAVDSILGPNSWEGFARGLEAGLK